MRTAILIASATFAAGAWAADDGAWDYYVRVAPQVTALRASGGIEWSVQGSNATRVTPRDLGLGDATAQPAIELGLELPLIPFGFHFGGFQWREDASLNADQYLGIGAAAFATGSTLTAEASVTDLYGEASLRLAPLTLDIAGVAPGIAVHQVASTLRVAGVGQEQKWDSTLYIPALSLRAYVAPPVLDGFEIEGMVHAFRVVLGRDSARFVQAQVQVAWYPIDYVAVTAGWRHSAYGLHLERGDKGSFDLDLVLSGPFAGLQLRI